MATVNKVILIGRVCAEPEPAKTIPNGSTVASFRLAVGRSKKNAAGQWENDPHPLFIDCEAWKRSDEKRDLPNVIAQYVKKGDQIYVEGQLVFEQWDDKATGTKRSKHKLRIDQIELLGNAGGGSTDGAPRQEARKPAGKPTEEHASVGEPTVDYGDSVPF